MKYNINYLNKGTTFFKKTSNIQIFFGLSVTVTFNLLLYLHLTFALVSSLVQNGLGGHDFPIPEKQ